MRRHLVRVTLIALPLAAQGFLPQVAVHAPNTIGTKSLSITCLFGAKSDSSRRSGGRLRRAFRKVLNRNRSSRKDSVFSVSQKDDAPMQGSTRMQMSTMALDEVETVANLDFLLRQFEHMFQSDSLSNAAQVDTYETATRDYALHEYVNGNAILEGEGVGFVDDVDYLLMVNQPQPKIYRAAVMNRMAKGYVEGLLLGLVHRWSVTPPRNLQVVVEPKGNVVSGIVRGKFKTDIDISFTKLNVRPIQLSEGNVQARGLTLNLWSFTPDMLRKGARRFPSQFDFYFNDCVFTEEDLMQSRSIRNGLQRLLTRILQRAGVSSDQVNELVKVTSIRVLSNGKISCAGEAGSAFAGRIPFEVRSGISLASRGHVVTFPGMEVSLQPSLGVFVPTFSEIDLDIGHNARLLSVDINGKQKTLKFSAKATVTPEHTLKLKEYLQTKESLGAQFTFDVGRWLTKIGNFTR